MQLLTKLNWKIAKNGLCAHPSGELPDLPVSWSCEEKETAAYWKNNNSPAGDNQPPPLPHPHPAI